MADSPALLISPLPRGGAEGRFQRHKRKGRPWELSRYGALPRTPCGAHRKRMLLYLVSLLKVGPHSGGGMAQRRGFLPHMAVPRHPPAGSVCLVFWADRGPGASCPYGEGPRCALVTFPRWKVTRGDGLCPQARFEANRRRRLLGRDGAAPLNCIIFPASQRGLSVRTHSLNPTFSFRPAEKRTCR